MKYSIKLIEIENEKGEITHIEQYAQTKEVNPSQKEEFITSIAKAFNQQYEEVNKRIN